ncbi:uncharacterized protein LOC113332106 [Papaver somniferum]|uniref:uncharacterized protein LOC113332106 n=1 Tax=Papaver somniferum TaxID=3469 RepID=UPI000E70493F|nr:uncharacterized protein LOC113332106 [Papaver somniferum]
MSYDVVENTIQFTWNFIPPEDVKIIEVDTNVMIFKLKNKTVVDKVIDEGSRNIDGYLVILFDYLYGLSHQELDWTQQAYWIQLKYIQPEYMTVKVVEEMGKLLGEVLAIEPKNAIPVGGVPVKVWVKIDLLKPLRRGALAITAAGVTKWVKFYYEKQPRKLCPKCNIINHCEGACKAAIEYVEALHKHPLPFGGVGRLKKSLTARTSASSTPNQNSRMNGRNITFTPQDGVSVKISSVTDSNEVQARLGKRKRFIENKQVSEDADQGEGNENNTEGDLNFVLTQDEKEGGNLISQTVLDDSNRRLNVNGLHSMSFVGNPFTWSNRRAGHEIILEILDRVLYNFEWMNLSPNSTSFHLIPLASDHCPILLVTDRIQNNTYKPFRMNRTWLRNPSCKEVIKNNWIVSDPGSNAYRVTRSQHNIKVALSIANQNESLVDLEKNLIHWLDAQANFWKQRNRDEDLRNGDRNTAYFHNKVNFRKKITNIDTLKNTMGVWVSDRNDIASTLKDYFFYMSRTTIPDDPTEYFESFSPCIADSENSMLTRIPDSDEVKHAIFSMQSWNTPGPDGYPPGFYQQMWDVVGDDIVRMVQSFFHSKHILKQINHNFTALIPKRTASLARLIFVLLVYVMSPIK